MSLDTAGARASETGWTPAAIKAEKKAKRKAEAKARWRGVRGFIGDCWNFLLRNILLWLALAASIGTGLWEWVNTTRGWRDLYPGVADDFIMAGAAAAVVGWYVGARMLIEETRKPKRSAISIGGWFVAAFATYIVCVAGVFIATATNQVEAQRAALENRKEWVQLVAQRDEYRAKFEVYDELYWEAAIEADQRAIRSLLAIANGTYAMPNLDVEGPEAACAQKLSYQQRQLCVQMNGGRDEHTGQHLLGMRAELKASERGLEQAKKDRVTLTALEAQVRDFKRITGDETAEAVGAMFATDEGGEIDAGDAGKVMGWILLVLSSLFLLGSGWSNDWALEEIERRRKAARIKAGKDP